MTSRARRKGDSAEREIALLLSKHFGRKIRRKYGAGLHLDEGDIDLPHCTVQVRNWRDVAAAIRLGLQDLSTQQANAKTRHGVLFVRRYGGKWIAVQDLAQWLLLYTDATTEEKDAPESHH